MTTAWLSGSFGVAALDGRKYSYDSPAPTLLSAPGLFRFWLIVKPIQQAVDQPLHIVSMSDGDCAAAGSVPVKAADATARANSPQQSSDSQVMERTHEHLRMLPKESGVALMTFGIIGVLLLDPFDIFFVVAGALVFTPRLFHRTELWVQAKFPRMHEEARRHIDRYIDAFEQRFPPAAGLTAGSGVAAPMTADHAVEQQKSVGLQRERLLRQEMSDPPKQALLRVENVVDGCMMDLAGESESQGTGNVP